MFLRLSAHIATDAQPKDAMTDGDVTYRVLLSRDGVVAYMTAAARFDAKSQVPPLPVRGRA
jgi:hypothetical protein